MFQTTDGHPNDFEAFRAGRSRFLDRLAAESLLYRIERAAERGDQPTQEDDVDPPIVVDGEPSILIAERRLVLNYFSPGQCDLADVVREGLGLCDEAFGVGRLGHVRITVERLPPSGRPVCVFDRKAEAVARANDCPHGLAADVFTGDLGRAMRVGDALEVGMVAVNRGRVSNVAAPFGGVKQSGYGHSGGADALGDYLDTRYLSVGVSPEG